MNLGFHLLDSLFIEVITLVLADSGSVIALSEIPHCHILFRS